MEIIFSILIFAVAVTISVQLFAYAATVRNRSFDIQMAVIMAQNAAEIFKATGEGEEIQIPGGHFINMEGEPGQLVLFFDRNWEHTSIIYSRYIMTVEMDLNRVPARSNISVTDRITGEELHSLEVLRYMGRD